MICVTMIQASDRIVRSPRSFFVIYKRPKGKHNTQGLCVSSSAFRYSLGQRSIFILSFLGIWSVISNIRPFVCIFCICTLTAMFYHTYTCGKYLNICREKYVFTIMRLVLFHISSNIPYHISSQDQSESSKYHPPHGSANLKKYALCWMD